MLNRRKGGRNRKYEMQIEREKEKCLPGHINIIVKQGKKEEKS